MAEPSGNRRAARAVAVAAGLLLSVAAGGAAPGILAAQAAGTSTPAHRATVSATAGVGRPSEGIFRDIYGGTVTPVAVQASTPAGAGGLELFAGARLVRTTGAPVAEGGRAAAANEGVRFRMTTVNVGVGWSVSRAAWTAGVGLGGSYNRYREEWPAFGLRTTGARAGLVAQASATRWVFRRLGILLRGEYSLVPEARASDELASVNLGGVDLTAGVAFRF